MFTIVKKKLRYNGIKHLLENWLEKQYIYYSYN